jgi:hypothetical protein
MYGLLLIHRLLHNIPDYLAFEDLAVVPTSWFKLPVVS